MKSKPVSPDSERTSRRRFTKSVAATLTAFPLAAALAKAQTPAKPKEPTGRAGGYSASLVTAVDYLHAMRMRAPMRRAWDEMFAKHGLLVAPSRATVFYPLDKTFDKAYPDVSTSSPIAASNLVGVPAISVPNGFGLENLPTGIQLIGPAWSENTLLDLAVKYQQATDWHKRRPSL